MKKFLVNYYVVITQLLFIIYNILLRNLRIGGYLYQIYMILFIVLNIFTLIKMRRNIKWKNLAIIVYFLISIFSKDILQAIIVISSMITLIIIGFKESNFVKVITILIALFIIIFFIPLLLLLFSFLIVSNMDNRKDMYAYVMYEYYYCDNNYEAYAYPANIMGNVHYGIGKRYEILNIGDIIYIDYNKRNEKSKQEYKEYIKKNNCKSAGNKGGG